MKKSRIDNSRSRLPVVRASRCKASVAIEKRLVELSDDSDVIECVVATNCCISAAMKRSKSSYGMV